VHITAYALRVSVAANGRPALARKDRLWLDFFKL
jgi:hypothetical protein